MYMAPGRTRGRVPTWLYFSTSIASPVGDGWVVVDAFTRMPCLRRNSLRNVREANFASHSQFPHRAPELAMTVIDLLLQTAHFT